MPARRINPSRYADPGLLAIIIQQVRLSWRLLNDRRVPGALKALLPGLAVMYAISPIDAIPDFLVGIGQLDDLGIILAALALFVRLAPRAVVAEHQAALAGDARDTGQPSHQTPPRWQNDAVDVNYSVNDKRQGTAGR